ncbi:YgjV family protein [Candidatus Gracilibacteria bacterium]|nr:YgjV family protein [Candidatus Gracilibacteria bacterium]
MIKQFLGVQIFEIIAQGFGVAGILVLLFAFTQKDDFRTKQLVVIAIIVWLGHYILLEMEGAIYASLIALVRMYFSIYYPRNKFGIALVFFLTVALGFMSYDGIVSILPIIASILSILAYQVFNGFSMRVSLLLGSFLWLYYMIALQSIPGVVNEILAEIILVVTLIKIYLDEHKEQSIPQEFVQKIKYILNSRKIRKRRDFGRFTIFRDKKKYLEDNNIVYED